MNDEFSRHLRQLSDINHVALKAATKNKFLNFKLPGRSNLFWSSMLDSVGHWRLLVNGIRRTNHTVWFIRFNTTIFAVEIIAYPFTTSCDKELHDFEKDLLWLISYETNLVAISSSNYIWTIHYGTFSNAMIHEAPIYT